MAIKVYNPTSPGRRDASTLANEEITKRDPEKSLIIYKKKRAGGIMKVKLPYATRAAESNNY